jgi:spore germination protein YaaH
MASLAVDEGYDGISLDLEAGPASDRGAYSSFVAELAARLHAHGKQLTLAASAKARDSLTHPRSGIFDYPRISQDADWVVVMVWGLHWSTSAPGAQDELPWARSVADYVATMPLHRKFIYGTNLYAMDWPAGGGPSHPAATEQYGELVPRLPGLGADMRLETSVDGMHATYTDGGGVGHDVWYPDAGTTGRRMQMARDRGFGGVGFWRLGMEDQRVWSDPLVAPGAAW